LGKLKSSPDPWEGEAEGGYGWFQNPITLSPPAVPEEPDTTYFITRVVERIKVQIMPTASLVLQLFSYSFPRPLDLHCKQTYHVRWEGISRKHDS